jgi:hypothetical protein
MAAKIKKAIVRWTMALALPGFQCAQAIVHPPPRRGHRARCAHDHHESFIVATSHAGGDCFIRSTKSRAVMERIERFDGSVVE